MNYYDLALEFLRTVNEIDELLDKKTHAKAKEADVLDKKIDELEVKMFDIKNKLKAKEI